MQYILIATLFFLSSCLFESSETHDSPASSSALLISSMDTSLTSSSSQWAETILSSEASTNTSVHSNDTSLLSHLSSIGISSSATIHLSSSSSIYSLSSSLNNGTDTLSKTTSHNFLSDNSDREIMESMDGLVSLRRYIDSISNYDSYSCTHDSIYDECFSSLEAFYGKYQEHLTLIQSKTFEHAVILDTLYTFIHATDSSYDKLDSSYNCNESTGNWELQYDTIPDYRFVIKNSNLFMSYNYSPSYIWGYEGTSNTPFAEWEKSHTLFLSPFNNPEGEESVTEFLSNLLSKTQQSLGYGLEHRITLDKLSFLNEEIIRFNCFYDEQMQYHYQLIQSPHQTTIKHDCNSWTIKERLGLEIQYSYSFTNTSYTMDIQVSYNGKSCNNSRETSTSWFQSGSVASIGRSENEACTPEYSPVINQSEYNDHTDDCADSLYAIWSEDIKALENP